MLRLAKKDILALMNTSRYSTNAYGNRGKPQRKRGCRLPSELFDRRKAGPEWRSSRVRKYNLTPEELEQYLKELGL